MMWKSAVTFAVWFCVMGAALFLPTGTVDWRAGWIFLGEMMLLSAGTVVWLAKYDPGLLKERMGNPIQKGQPKRDKVFMLTMIVIWHGWIVLMALDVKRRHVSEAPDWATYTGAFLYVLGTPLVLGSWIGLALVPLVMGLLILRIFIEEAALRKGLPGYDEYTTRVRYRLVPRVW